MPRILITFGLEVACLSCASRFRISLLVVFPIGRVNELSQLEIKSGLAKRSKPTAMNTTGTIKKIIIAFGMVMFNSL